MQRVKGNQNGLPPQKDAGKARIFSRGRLGITAYLNWHVCLAIGSALLGGCSTQPYPNDASDVQRLLIFHNNSGPMCLTALDWLDSMKLEHPTLVVEEHLTYEIGETELLAELEAQFKTSQGLSSSFEYLPIVFFQGQAFSGFNDEIAEALQALTASASSASP